MNKKILLTGAVCIAIVALAGCGEKKDNALYNSLEQQVKHNVSYIEKEQLEVNLNLQAAVNGSEKEHIVKLLSNANIMNKPSKDASIVGSVKADESVLVIGDDNINGWYRVAYNGRVCYVEGTRLDLDRYVADNDNDDRDNDNEVNNGDNRRPTTTVTPQRPISTSSSNSSNSSSGNNSTSSSSGVIYGDDETTTVGGDIWGTEGTTPGGEENTTLGEGDPTTGNSGIEGTTPEESTSSSGSVGDTTVGEDYTSSEENTTSQEQTTWPSEIPSDIPSETPTETPVETPVETPAPTPVQPTEPSSEEQTTPQDTWIEPYIVDGE